MLSLSPQPPQPPRPALSALVCCAVLSLLRARPSRTAGRALGRRARGSTVGGRACLSGTPRDPGGARLGKDEPSERASGGGGAGGCVRERECSEGRERGAQVGAEGEERGVRGEGAGGEGREARGEKGAKRASERAREGKQRRRRRGRSSGLRSGRARQAKRRAREDDEGQASVVGELDRQEEARPVVWHAGRRRQGQLEHAVEHWCGRRAAGGRVSREVGGQARRGRRRGAGRRTHGRRPRPRLLRCRRSGARRPAGGAG